MRDILNRMNYRLKRIRKGKPLKKTQETDAIFANVKAVREQARDDPETLEISMDAKAKVALGDYVRGGNRPSLRETLPKRRPSDRPSRISGVCSPSGALHRKGGRGRTSSWI